MARLLRSRGVMERLNAIPKEERCGACAGFGRVFGLVNSTLIRYRKCRRCDGTGRVKKVE